MKQSKNNSKFLLNLVTILTNQKMHDRSMMCDRFLSCIGKATLPMLSDVANYATQQKVAKILRNSN